MIHIQKIYTLSGGTAPYSYTWNSSASCATFVGQTGTSTDGEVVLDVTFDTEACLTTAAISLTGSDANGCAFNQNAVLSASCDDLTLNTIGFTAPYTFTAAASSAGCENVTFTWYYDSALFNQVSVTNAAFTSNLTLVPKSNISAFPVETDIRVTATNCLGCEEVDVYTFAFCHPTLPTAIIPMYCETDELTDAPSLFTSANFQLPQPTGCTGITIDWSTLELGLPTGYTYTNLGNGVVKIQAPLTVSTGVVAGTWAVRTTNGIPSDQGALTLIVNACEATTTISLPNRVLQLDCGLEEDDIFEIDIEDWVVTNPGVSVDWDTWQIVEPPVTLSPFVTISVNLQGHHIIQYTVPDPIADDSFGWTVCDTEGNCAQATVYTVIQCVTAPVAVDDVACATCGETIYMSVLDNDNGSGSPLDIGSIQIVSLPSSGTVTLPGDGTIGYTADPTFAGEVEIVYKVANAYGTYSNDATVTVSVICAGTPAELSVCQ